MNALFEIGPEAKDRVEYQGSVRPVHDFGDDNRGWGHNYEVMKVLDGGHRVKVAGWKVGINQGDLFFTSNLKKGSCAVYLVASIEYCGDPRDMFFADLEYLPGMVAQVVTPEPPSTGGQS